MSTAALTSIDAVTAELAACNDVSTVMDIRAKAETMARYLRDRNVAENQALKAQIVARRAERRLGELIAAMPKAKGGGDKKSDHRSLTRTGDAPTLAEQGIDKRDAAQWQRIARIPEKRFESHLAFCSVQFPPTRASVLGLMRKARPAPRKLSPADAAISAWASLDAAQQRAFLKQTGLVRSADIERLEEQRCSDKDYRGLIAIQSAVAKSVALSRGQRIAAFVLDGGELAMLLLGVDWTVTTQSLNTAYKNAAKNAHPDSGGSADAFAKLTVARDLVTKMLGAP